MEYTLNIFIEVDLNTALIGLKQYIEILSLSNHGQVQNPNASFGQMCLNILLTNESLWFYRDAQAHRSYSPYISKHACLV